MKTSQFRKSLKYDNQVSIALYSPVWYKGREYKKLAPKPWFFKKYKSDKDEEFYIEQYYKEVLNKLNPEKVYEELGENAVLLCWERKEEFCHRHIAADWLINELNIEIYEDGMEKDEYAVDIFSL